MANSLKSSLQHQIRERKESVGIFYFFKKEGEKEEREGKEFKASLEVKLDTNQDTYKKG